jgi:hypothetical protein
MEQVINPFQLKGYHGANLFCDREAETEQLIAHAKNGMNVTLLSVRRMGKTGLIHHVFRKIEENAGWKTVYVDIYATQNLQEFTNQLATAILTVFPQEQSIGKKFIQLLKGFSPVISYDSFTGMPEVQLMFSSEQQKQHTIQGLFSFLEQQKQRVVVAIDEFQQIANYPEKNTEAILRTIVQQLTKTSFIFSGSHKHMLIEMFNSAKRPFFASTTPLHLAEISGEKYAPFIVRLFKENKKSIDNESIQFILEWTKRHTYYTQALCNKVFQNSSKKVTIKEVFKACDFILTEQSVIFFQYRNLLTAGQWDLLHAVAKEDVVWQPTGAGFVGKYKLGNSASVRRSLQALVDKEMVLKETNKEGELYYQVYNCFLSRWLARKP